jgi:hypothetical protein
MIFISSNGICEEDDFACSRSREIGLPEEKQKGIGSKRVDMSWIWRVDQLGDKFRTIAAELAM